MDIRSGEKVLLLSPHGEPSRRACQRTRNGQAIVFFSQRDAKGDRRAKHGREAGNAHDPHAYVSFNGVLVTEKDLLGQEGKGSPTSMSFLNTAKLKPERGTGNRPGRFDRALDYARKREQFGKAIVTFDPIRNNSQTCLPRSKWRDGSCTGPLQASIGKNLRIDGPFWQRGSLPGSLEVANEAIRSRGLRLHDRRQVSTFIAMPRRWIFSWRARDRKSMLGDGLLGNPDRRPVVEILNYTEGP